MFYVYGGADGFITKTQMDKFLTSVFSKEEMLERRFVQCTSPLTHFRADFELAFRNSQDGEKLTFFDWKNWVLDNKNSGALFFFRVLILDRLSSIKLDI